TFIRLIDKELRPEPNKPVLLVTALTLAHWPYVWARQPQLPTIADRYQESVQTLDKQFKSLYAVLKKKGLLQNSIIIILSDHGDSLGLPGDRIISQSNYQGPPDRLSLITRYSYTKRAKGQPLMGIDTSAGHGTDLLSLTQLQTTLAFYQNLRI